MIEGEEDWTEVRRMDLMFSSQMGAMTEASEEVYLRPETAQGIYVNFLQVQKSLRLNLPFGVAQTGKAFRNELIARQFTFRMREFEQMEMQFFVPPDEEKEWFMFWKAQRKRWYEALGMPEDRLHFVPHQKLAHYASDAVDIAYDFPFGRKEVEGLHARSDFDLKQHEVFSKKKLRYFDSSKNVSYLPHVVETSAGLDRLCLMVLCQALIHEKGDRPRVYLNFPAILAPVQVAVLPLVRKDGLPEVARKLREELRYDFSVSYEESASIGKRYARQDLIGTPYCLTVDHDTLSDQAVTVRERNSTQQVRHPLSSVKSLLKEKFSRQSFWQSLGPAR